MTHIMYIETDKLNETGSLPSTKKFTRVNAMYIRNNNNSIYPGRVIYKRIVLNGGTTLWTTIPEQHTGYLVAIKQYEAIVPITNDPQNVAEILQAYINEHMLKGHAVGFWEHKGHIYCDVVMHYSTQKTATHVGKLQAQLAIWDIEQSQSISLIPTSTI